MAQSVIRLVGFGCLSCALSCAGISSEQTKTERIESNLPHCFQNAIERLTPICRNQDPNVSIEKRVDACLELSVSELAVGYVLHAREHISAASLFAQQSEISSDKAAQIQRIKAQIVFATGDNSGAIAIISRFMDQIERGKPIGQEQLARMYLLKADILFSMGDSDAQRWLKAAIPLAQYAFSESPGDLVDAYMNLWDVCNRSVSCTMADEILNKIKSIRLEPGQICAQGRIDALVARANTKKVSSKESKQAALKSIALLKSCEGIQSIDLAEMKYYLAGVLVDEGDFQRAEKLLNEALNLLMHLTPGATKKIQELLIARGALFLKRGRNDEARSCFTRIIEEYNRTEYKLPISNLIGAHSFLALICANQNEEDNAEKHLEKACSLDHGSSAEHRFALEMAISKVLLVKLQTGHQFMKGKNAEQASRVFQRAIDLQSLCGTVPSMTMARIWFAQGLLMSRKGNSARAKDHLSHSVKAIEECSPDSPELVPVLEALASVLRNIGEKEKAERIENRARNMRHGVVDPNFTK